MLQIAMLYVRGAMFTGLVCLGIYMSDECTGLGRCAWRFSETAQMHSRCPWRRSETAQKQSYYSSL